MCNHADAITLTAEMSVREWRRYLLDLLLGEFGRSQRLQGPLIETCPCQHSLQPYHAVSW
jgi:hypothetical protein